MAEGEMTQERTQDRSTRAELTRDEGTSHGKIGYEQWGHDFFTEAISEERVLDAVRIIAGEQIEFGPVRAGPGGIATVQAYGEVRQASATRIPGEHVAYRVMLPLGLTFEVALQVEQKFEAEVVVPLTLRAVPWPGVRIFIEAEAPETGDMRIDLRAQGMRSSVLQRVSDVEGELRRFVAEYVIELLERPHVRATRTIDVCGAMDGVWAVIGPKPEDG